MDLAARIAANDAVIERINRKGLPDGANGLVGAELVARGLHSFGTGGSFVPRTTAEMKLPAFEYSGREPYSWPRSQR